MDSFFPQPKRGNRLDLARQCNSMSLPPADKERDARNCKRMAVSAAFERSKPMLKCTPPRAIAPTRIGNGERRHCFPVARQHRLPPRHPQAEGMAARDAQGLASARENVILTKRMKTLLVFADGKTRDASDQRESILSLVLSSHSYLNDSY